MQTNFAVTGRFCRSLLLVVTISLVALPGLAGDTPPPAAGTTETGSTDQLDAILQELKAIRQVLEKIEQQGPAGKQKPSRPTSAAVKIRKGTHAMGSNSAPVTVVEFTDYQCPFCLRFIKTTFPSLKRDYIDTGKVRWVALNMPLPFHKDARKAAQAAQCAGDQNKFWEMRAELFANPKQLAEADLPQHAARVGLDVAAFKACLASDRHLAEIDQEGNDARAVQLTGTPSFIVGKTASDKISGQVVVGAQPLNVFTSAIQKALDQVNAK